MSYINFICIYCHWAYTNIQIFFPQCPHSVNPTGRSYAKRYRILFLIFYFVDTLYQPKHRVQHHLLRYLSKNSENGIVHGYITLIKYGGNEFGKQNNLGKLSVRRGSFLLKRSRKQIIPSVIYHSF